MKFQAQTRSLTDPRPGGEAGSTVVVEPLRIGTVKAPPGLFENPGGRLETLRRTGLLTRRSKWLTVPVPAFLIRHPTAGPLLVDTGLHSSIVAKPVANLGRQLAS